MTISVRNPLASCQAAPLAPHSPRTLTPRERQEFLGVRDENAKLIERAFRQFDADCAQTSQAPAATGFRSPSIRIE
jgi:hypothetical protein